MYLLVYHILLLIGIPLIELLSNFGRYKIHRTGWSASCPLYSKVLYGFVNSTPMKRWAKSPREVQVFKTRCQLGEKTEEYSYYTYYTYYPSYTSYYLKNRDFRPKTLGRFWGRKSGKNIVKSKKVKKLLIFRAAPPWVP